MIDDDTSFDDDEIYWDDVELAWIHTETEMRHNPVLNRYFLYVGEGMRVG